MNDEVKATGLIQKDSEVLQIEDSIFEEFKEVVDHIDFFFPFQIQYCSWEGTWIACLIANIVIIIGED